MEVKGRLEYKGEIQHISNTFEKQEFVIEFAENPQYPEFIKFELIQGKCGEIDKFNIGTTITVAFNLKGNKWEDPQGGVKYFNTLQAWKITGDNDTRSEQQTSWQDDQSDDLPF